VAGSVSLYGMWRHTQHVVNNSIVGGAGKISRWKELGQWAIWAWSQTTEMWKQEATRRSAPLEVNDIICAVMVWAMYILRAARRDKLEVSLIALRMEILEANA